METLPSKAKYREQFRTYRRGLDNQERRARSALIVHRTLSLPLLETAGTVHVYWPQATHGEVDTTPLIAALRATGRIVVLPVVTSYDWAAPALEHRRYEGLADTTVNRWGIREPDGTPRVSPDSFDVVVVPALGAGRNGHRIGHGAGYYDVFLSDVSAPCIGLVYEACLRPSIPSAPHDIPLSVVVTERNVVPVS